MAQSAFSSKVLKGFVWLGYSNLLGQVITWAATLVVIRLLMPSDYGLMAMAAVCINFLAAIGEMGINSSIIRTPQVEKEELRCILGFLLVSCGGFWALLYFSAPAIANFYGEQRLVVIIRVLSSIFLITPWYKISESLLIRDMNFRVKARVDISAQITMSLLSLFLAFQGMGVWTLVFALIALHVIKLVGYNLAHPSVIIPRFNFMRITGHLKYGLVVTWEQILHYIYTSADTVIVGKMLGDKLLGIYNIALNLASIPMEKVLPIVTQVAFTSYARIQDDMERIRRNVLRSIRVVAIFVFPVFFGMAGVVSVAVPLILGDKWQEIIVPFQIICFILPLKALSTLLPPVLFAIDRVWLNLTNKAISCVVMIAAFLFGVRYGLLGVCYGWLVAYPVVFAVTTARCLRILNLPARLYIREVFYPCAGSLLMLAGLLLLKSSGWLEQPLIYLAVSILLSSCFYISFYLFFRKEDIVELKALFSRPS